MGLVWRMQRIGSHGGGGQGQGWDRGRGRVVKDLINQDEKWRLRLQDHCCPCWGVIQSDMRGFVL